MQVFTYLGRIEFLEAAGYGDRKGKAFTGSESGLSQAGGYSKITSHSQGPRNSIQGTVWAPWLSLGPQLV